MSTNKIIKNIIDNDLCIGCGLCEGINDEVVMKLNNKGFLTPIFKEDKIINNITLEECCPGINTYANEDIEKGFWGNIEGCYTGYSTDEKIRHSGSSGGSITAMIINLIETNVIDGVIQVGPNFDKSPFFNEVYFNTTYDEVINCASSRYSPSSPLMNINTMLSKDLKIAFVGKPCDVTALRNLAKHDKRIDEKIKFMFSFFCAGLPSEIGSDNVLKKLDVQKSDVKTFRYRGNGWPGKTSVLLEDGTITQMTYNESWGKILGKEIHYRCKICPDSIGMSSDVVAADAWYSKGDGYPDFEEKDGRSLLISRNKKGEKLLESMRLNDSLILKELDSNEIFAMQPGQVRKREELLGRVIAIKTNPFQIVPEYSLRNIYELSKNTTKVKNIKAFLGMYKRSLKKVLKIKNQK